MPLTGGIAAQEYPEATDDVTMSESRTTFPTSNGSSCRSSERDLWMLLGVIKKCVCSCKLSGKGCSILVSKKRKHRFRHL